MLFSDFYQRQTRNLGPSHFPGQAVPAIFCSTMSGVCASRPDRAEKYFSPRSHRSSHADLRNLPRDRVIRGDFRKAPQLSAEESSRPRRSPWTVGRVSAPRPDRVIPIVRGRACSTRGLAPGENRSRREVAIPNGCRAAREKCIIQISKNLRMRNANLRRVRCKSVRTNSGQSLIAVMSGYT